MRHRRCAVLLLPLLVGCRNLGDSGANYTKAAQEEFTKAFSCPKERVTATPRPDLKAYDLAVGPSTPPKDVAADPGRLAQWKKDQAKVAEGYEREYVIQTRGCGHEVYYLCTVGNGTDGYLREVCSTAQHPPK
jgi:hypothetical protein